MITVRMTAESHSSTFTFHLRGFGKIDVGFFCLLAAFCGFPKSTKTVENSVLSVQGNQFGQIQSFFPLP